MPPFIIKQTFKSMFFSEFRPCFFLILWALSMSHTVYFIDINVDLCFGYDYFYVFMLVRSYSVKEKECFIFHPNVICGSKVSVNTEFSVKTKLTKLYKIRCKTILNQHVILAWYSHHQIGVGYCNATHFFSFYSCCSKDAVLIVSLSAYLIMRFIVTVCLLCDIIALSRTCCTATDIRGWRCCYCSVFFIFAVFLLSTYINARGVQLVSLVKVK